MMPEQPNFLIIVADQLRADAVGPFGNRYVRTPSLDRLAADGTCFTNAYAQHPVCSPNRASFLTGWYPHTAGHRSLRSLIKAGEPNLLRILRDAGYHVTWLGARGDTFAPGVTELSVHEYGFSEPPGKQPSRQDPDHDLWDRLYYRGRRAPGVIDHDEAAIRSGEKWLRSPPRDPWVLFVPLFAPHCPFEVEEPWYAMYDRAALPDPVRPGDRAGEPGYMLALRDVHGLDRATALHWREVTATYYGMISRLDSQVGRLLSGIENAGAAGNTVALFFSDHGEYLGDYGLIEKWPSAMHACITRDPLIISGAGLPGGQHCPAMVELVDVVPTVLELAGVQAPHRHFGRSLLPLLHDAGARASRVRVHRGRVRPRGGAGVRAGPVPLRPQDCLAARPARPGWEGDRGAGPRVDIRVAAPRGP
jgi:arylsulfatase A-like enzyme